jgi:hypothetical protein
MYDTTLFVPESEVLPLSLLVLQLLLHLNQLAQAALLNLSPQSLLPHHYLFQLSCAAQSFHALVDLCDISTVCGVLMQFFFLRMIQLDK